MICHRDKKLCVENCAMYDLLNKWCMEAKLQEIYIGWALDDTEEAEEPV